MAQEADRLKFGLGEIDAVDPQPGEDDALSTISGGCPSSTRCARPPKPRDPRYQGRSTTTADADAASAANECRAGQVGVGGHRRHRAAGAGGAAWREALAVIGDVSTELGDYLTELPSDASTLETKLARQGELRALTRKYAADIDGVLAWARESRDRLAQLDVSEETSRAWSARWPSWKANSSPRQPNSARRAPRRPRASPRR